MKKNKNNRIDFKGFGTQFLEQLAMDTKLIIKSTDDLKNRKTLQVSTLLNRLWKEIERRNKEEEDYL